MATPDHENDGEQAADGGGPIDHREIRGAIEAIARDYPAVSAERIEQLVLEAYRRRSDATIRQYRGVLAERDARARLRAEARSPDSRQVTAELHSTERPPGASGAHEADRPTPPVRSLRLWRSARGGAVSGNTDADIV